MATGGAIKKINNSSRERETTQDGTDDTHAHTRTERRRQQRPNVYVYARPDYSRASMGRACSLCVCSLPYLSTKA